jgi:hypothetical protein
LSESPQVKQSYTNFTAEKFIQYRLVAGSSPSVRSRVGTIFKGEMTMSSNVIFFGWNRSVPGREQMSAEHFQEYLQYLGRLQQEGAIDSFETILLSPHGGDMNGFFLIRGDNDALNALQGSDEWLTHVARGGHHLEGAGAVRGVTGELVMGWMNRWGSLIAG